MTSKVYNATGNYTKKNFDKLVENACKFTIQMYRCPCTSPDPVILSEASRLQDDDTLHEFATLIMENRGNPKWDPQRQAFIIRFTHKFYSSPNLMELYKQPFFTTVYQPGLVERITGSTLFQYHRQLRQLLQ